MTEDYKGLLQTRSRDIRENFFNEINKKIHNAQFVSNSRTESGRKGFTRNRKISFAHLIVLLVQGLSRSIQRELNSFYQKLQNSDLPIQYVVKSSFTKCRSKLKHTAFIELNKTGLASFYRDAPYQKWQGFRLLAIDGSTAVLPRSADIAAVFGSIGFGPTAKSSKSVARCSVLYDVLNLTVLDGQLDRYEVAERELALRHVEMITPGADLVLFDRGYPGFDFMYTLQQAGIHYLIRLSDKWWLEAKKMLTGIETDKEIIFTTSNRNLFKCRLIAVKLDNGTTEILCTTLLDKEQYPQTLFKDLYHKRWNIEEGYKLFKSRIQLEAFSGKTALSIRQDFFAKLFMMTTAAVLAFPVEEKIKTEEGKSKYKHAYKLNRTNTLAAIKDNFSTIIFKKMIRPCLKAIDEILRRTTEIIRPGRSFPRKKIKKKPPSSNYKHL